MCGDIRVVIPKHYVIILDSNVLQDEIFLFVSPGGCGWLGWLAGGLPRLGETEARPGQSLPASLPGHHQLPGADLIANTDNIIDLSLLRTQSREQRTEHAR